MGGTKIYALFAIGENPASGWLRHAKVHCWQGRKLYVLYKKAIILCRKVMSNIISLGLSW